MTRERIAPEGTDIPARPLAHSGGRPVISAAPLHFPKRPGLFRVPRTSPIRRAPSIRAFSLMTEPVGIRLNRRLFLPHRSMDHPSQTSGSPRASIAALGSRSVRRTASAASLYSPHSASSASPAKPCRPRHCGTRRGRPACAQSAQAATSSPSPLCSKKFAADGRFQPLGFRCRNVESGPHSKQLPEPARSSRSIALGT